MQMIVDLYQNFHVFRKNLLIDIVLGIQEIKNLMQFTKSLNIIRPKSKKKPDELAFFITYN